MTPDFQSWLNSTWMKLKDRTACDAYIALDMDGEQTLTLSAVGRQDGNATDISYTRIRPSTGESGITHVPTTIPVRWLGSKVCAGAAPRFGDCGLNWI
jgi:hypothetical protein